MVINSIQTSLTTKSEVLKGPVDVQKPQHVLHGVQAIKYLKELDTLLEANPNINMVLDFWADYCGQCKAFYPTFESLCEKFQKEFIFATLDIEHDIRISHKYKITSIPTQVIIRNGSLVYKHVGAIDYKGLENIIERYSCF